MLIERYELVEVLCNDVCGSREVERQNLGVREPHDHAAHHVRLRNAVFVIGIAEAPEPVVGVVQRMIRPVLPRVPEIQRRHSEMIDKHGEVRARTQRSESHRHAGGLCGPGGEETRGVRVLRISRRLDDETLQ